MVATEQPERFKFLALEIRHSCRPFVLTFVAFLLFAGHRCLELLRLLPSRNMQTACTIT